jgi:Domain of unknown function (DUF397)
MTRIDVSRAVWHKSNHSSQDGNCVEVARNLPGAVAVRDSKDPNGPALVVTHEAWRSFLSSLRSARSEQ